MNDHERTSMLYWYPRVEGAVRTPKTVLLDYRGRPRFNPIEVMEAPNAEAVALVNEITEDIKSAASELGGYPVFLRFKRTCFVDDPSVVANRVYHLAEETEMRLGFEHPNFGGFAVRELLDLDAPFTAFWGRLPVARERRWFVERGEITGRHAYWPAAAIEEFAALEDSIAKEKSNYERILPGDWRELLAEINGITGEETQVLDEMALAVAVVLEGDWALDFARTRAGAWCFIDAAAAALSEREGLVPDGG